MFTIHHKNHNISLIGSVFIIGTISRPRHFEAKFLSNFGWITTFQNSSSENCVNFYFENRAYTHDRSLFVEKNKFLFPLFDTEFIQRPLRMFLCCTGPTWISEDLSEYIVNHLVFLIASRKSKVSLVIRLVLLNTFRGLVAIELVHLYAFMSVGDLSDRLMTPEGAYGPLWVSCYSLSFCGPDIPWSYFIPYIKVLIFVFVGT